MLPKKITISAFGPYQDIVEISFESFVQSGLFLITGPTGAGKTMIFDAIMFALYGVTSGSERQTNQLRSDQAIETIKTFVELTFVLHNETFTIYRSPTYFLPNKKTPKLPSALLTLPSGEIIEGIKEVNQKVISILGIDEKQFKQIAMIAQGEFTKLIYAGSDEREKVLRNLFNTEKYRALEEQLKEQTKIYKESYDVLFKQRALQLEKLHIDNSDIDMHEVLKEKKENTRVLEVEARKKQKEYQEINQKLQFIKANNTRIQSLAEIREQLTLLSNQKEYYQEIKKTISHIKEIKTIQPTYEKKQLFFNQKQEVNQEIEKIDKQVLSIQDSYKLWEKQYTLISNDKEMKESLQKEYQSLLQTKESLLLWLEGTSKQKEIDKILEQLEQDILNKQEHVKEKEKKLDKDLQSINMIEILKQEFIIKQKEYEALNERKTEIHTLNSLYNRSIQEEDIRFDLEEVYKKIEKDYDKKRVLFEQMERHYQYEQAGMLATTLRSNEPCPVCGSLEHPSPANLHTKSFDYEVFNNLKEEVTRLLEMKNEAYQKVLLKKQELKLLLSDISNKANELNIHKELSKELFVMELSGIKRKEKDMKESYQAMKDEIQYLEKLKRTVAHNQADVKELHIEIEELQKIQKEQYSKKNQLDGIVSTYAINTDITLEQIEETILNKKKQIKAISLQIQQIETEYTKTKEEKITLESTQKTLLNQQDKIQKEYIVANSEFKKALDNKKISETQFMESINKVSQLDILEQDYQQYITQSTSLKQQQTALEKEVGSNQIMDSIELEKQVQTIVINQKDLDKQLVQSRTELLNYEQLINDVTDINIKIEDMQKQYQQYLHLSNITSGKNGYRVSFERYVLAAYFERMLVYANEILTKMSQGRYQLYRRDNRSKGNAKQGLELDVLDMESGLMRDVKTLSGGESFKAALSLALGMSQMIQSYAGGIELQTLFIDEGFGSLDSQSLDQAIACLMELQQDNKLIGIISHVSELKERIDSKIIVTRNHQESKIILETN
ncbi:MAG: AAA family ATPase [Coprobacillaceae bacterium]